MHQFRLPVAYRIDAPFDVLPVDRWPYPWQRPAVANDIVTVAGELCTPNDVLTRDQPVDRLRAGDVLVFPRAGAYGWDISPLDYLRHPHPAVIVLDSPG
jgi:diaminopimelate decarboxylase